MSAMVFHDLGQNSTHSKIDIIESSIHTDHNGSNFRFISHS